MDTTVTLQGMAATVSVCVPTYQGARFLSETLDSILAQDYDDFELVVCDNASTDSTPEILASYDDPRLRVVRNTEVVDLPTNWRNAVEASTGTLVKVVCADDLLAPGVLRRQAEILQQHPEVTLVSSRRAMIDAESRVRVASTGLGDLAGMRDGREVARSIVRRGGANPVGESAATMFRRADYEQVGGWDRTHVYPMDIDLWIKLAGLGRFYGIPEPLAAFRRSDSNLSAAHSREQYEELRALMRQVSADRVLISRPDAWRGAAIRRVAWSILPLRRLRHRPHDRWLSAQPFPTSVD